MNQRDARRLERKVSRIYRRVDRVVSQMGPECGACGNCCYFDKDFVLYASSPEVWYLLRKAEAPSALVPGRCPYHGPPLCRVWEYRPLGCRTYFCDRARRVELEDIHNKALQILKRASAEEGLGWRYAPMLELLEEQV